MNETILIVDDDPAFQRLVERVLTQEGFRIQAVATGREALVAMESGAPDLMLLDLNLPDIAGMELLPLFRTGHPDLPVLILTTDTNLDRAVECMRLGALDYIPKPFERIRLVTSIRNAFALGVLSERVRSLTSELRRGEGFATLLGESAALKSALAMLARVAPRDVSVLLEGESGTGKELAARAIHAESPRRSAPFVVVNCGAIPEGLIESELFGHEKGAFTGAVESKTGCFEQARGGTIFLDEIGELRLDLQVRLLRVIQERTVRRVGATAERKVDVRVIAATNRGLKDEVTHGRFREDLYYRLAVFPCVLPPLRDRDDDVALLAKAFLAQFGPRHGRTMTDISPRALQALRGHRWPGNVRELANAMERAILLEDGPVISLSSLPDAVVDSLVDPEHYPDALPLGSRTAAPPPAAISRVCDWRSPSDIVPLESTEEEMIRRALELTGWNIHETARLLGVGRTTLYRKIELYALRIERRTASQRGGRPGK